MPFVPSGDMADARTLIAALDHMFARPCITDSRHYLAVAPNLLAQSFVATAPDTIWLADITYIATGEGWLYPAAVLDLVTRKIVEWAMRDHMRTKLPLTAMMMRAAQRQRLGYRLICHSDRARLAPMSTTCPRSARRPG